MEFSDGNIHYIVNIKSGPNWGNSSQINKMKSDFSKAVKIFRTSNSKINVRCINGCCYGKELQVAKDGYEKYCGSKFWEFISGSPTLYTDIIEPLGHKAKENSDAFHVSRSRLLNKLTHDFLTNFCTPAGEIDWIKIVEINSKC